MATALIVFSCSQSFCLGFCFTLSFPPSVFLAAPVGMLMRPFDFVKRKSVVAFTRMLMAKRSIGLLISSVGKYTFKGLMTRLQVLYAFCFTVVRRTYAHEGKLPESSLNCKKCVLVRCNWRTRTCKIKWCGWRYSGPNAIRGASALLSVLGG